MLVTNPDTDICKHIDVIMKIVGNVSRNHDIRKILLFYIIQECEDIN